MAPDLDVQNARQPPGSRRPETTSTLCRRRALITAPRSEASAKPAGSMDVLERAGEDDMNIVLAKGNQKFDSYLHTRRCTSTSCARRIHTMVAMEAAEPRRANSPRKSDFEVLVGRTDSLPSKHLNHNAMYMSRTRDPSEARLLSQAWTTRRRGSPSLQLPGPQCAQAWA